MTDLKTLEAILDQIKKLNKTHEELTKLVKQLIPNKEAKQDILR